jgi:uncharacterized protein (TIGR03000 family)
VKNSQVFDVFSMKRHSPRIPEVLSGGRTAMSRTNSCAPAAALAAGLWLAVGHGTARADEPVRPPAADRPALIEVQAPAGAEVWFDDAKTSSTGAFRRFVSPPLTAGIEFHYDVRVRWTEDGRPVERTQRLAVHSGARIALEYAGAGEAPAGAVAAAYESEPAAVETRTSNYPPAAAPALPAQGEVRYQPPVYLPAAAPAFPARRVFRYQPAAPAASPPKYYDPGPPAGPPGSNDPMSLGVGNG